MTEQKIEIDAQLFKNRHSREGGNLKVSWKLSA